MGQNRAANVNRGMPAVVTLSNGLRVAVESMPQAYSVAVVVWVGAGSHYESAAEGGASHFLEHMLFKGTASRSGRELAAQIDRLGGEVNASTSRDATVYYARVLPEAWQEATHLLADMLLHPRLDPEDVERERQVILEEVRGENENPESAGQDLFDATMWDAHPLGRPVAGTEASVAALPWEALLRIREDLYTPDNAVVAVSGRVTTREALRVIGQAFGGWTGTRRRDLPPPPAYAPRTATLKRDLDQAQLFIGCAAPGLHDPGRYAATLLAVTLGGGTSSRLFQRIREDEGLAYSVEAYHEVYSTAGLIGVYAGVEPTRVRHTALLAREEMRRLAEQPLPQEELDRARAQVRSSLLLGLESPAERAMRAGESLLLLRQIVPPEHVLANLAAVQPEEVQTMAQRLLAGPLTVTAVGPMRRIDLMGV